MKLSEYQRSRSFFDFGQRSLRFQSSMFDFWPVYSGERFRASWPSCSANCGKAPTSNQILKSNVYFDLIRSRDSMLLLGCNVNYVPIVIVWRFSKYIKM